MDSSIHCKVELACDTQTAFNHFVQNHLLETWLTLLADVEPKLHGKYELFWEPEVKSRNSTIGCQISAFENNQMLAFDWKSPVQFAHFANDADPLTHVSVSFIPSGDGASIHLIHSGWRQSSDWQAARQWQATAWQTAFNRLCAVVESKQV